MFVCALYFLPSLAYKQSDQKFLSDFDIVDQLFINNTENLEFSQVDKKVYIGISKLHN